MLQTVMRSSDFAAEERMPRFDEAAGMQVTSAVDSTDPERLRFTMQCADLGGVLVQKVDFATACTGGVSRVIQPDGGDLCSAMLLLAGALPVAQAGRAAEISGGEFTVLDGTRPAEIMFVEDNPRSLAFRLMRVQVPRAVLPVSATGLGRLTATCLPGRHGVGGLLTQFLANIADDPSPYTAGDVTRLGTIVTDLLAAALTHHLDDPARLPDSSRRAANLQGIQAYIQRHLGDPDLSPRSIAAAHHISVSYLHRLFSEEDVTVAAWVRSQRLERARRDLADPALSGMPVHRIATRWGFADHATFTRAFRGVHEIPPQTYRENVLNRPVSAPVMA